MAALDEQVNGWILEKFFESSRYEPTIHGEHDDVTVVAADMGWDCGCYSSWTRDDDFRVTAKLATKGGNTEFTYGRWVDFPQFIEELDEYINRTCYYESEEYRDGSD